MNFSSTIRLGAAAALTTVAFTLPVQAAVVISSMNTILQAPAGLQAAPTSAVNFRINLSADDLNKVAPDARSPYSGTTTPGAYYNAVQIAGSATYLFAGIKDSLSFMWGSPDSYNFIDFWLNGAVINTFTGLDLVGTKGPGTQATGFVNVTFAGPFDKYVLRNGGQDAFEYTNMAVPEPGSLALLGLGLAGLAAVARRKQKQA